VEVLLDSKADVSATTTDGRTPLFLAVEESEEPHSLVRLLLGHEADASVCRYNGETPLHFSARRGNEAVVSLLLEHGADASARTLSGETPMHSLVAGGHAIVQAEHQGGHHLVQPASDADQIDHRVVVQLVAHGASVSAKVPTHLSGWSRAARAPTSRPTPWREALVSVNWPKLAPPPGPARCNAALRRRVRLRPRGHGVAAARPERGRQFAVRGRPDAPPRYTPRLALPATVWSRQYDETTSQSSPATSNPKRIKSGWSVLYSDPSIRDMSFSNPKP
jgi:hypothetical protein